MQQMQNRVTLIGNLGSDIQITTLATGQTVARTSIATHDNHKKEDGTYEQITQWHKLVVWGAKAEYMAKRLEKGSFVIVYGRLVHRAYDDKDGITRYISEIIVREFETPQKKTA